MFKTKIFTVICAISLLMPLTFPMITAASEENTFTVSAENEGQDKKSNPVQQLRVTDDASAPDAVVYCVNMTHTFAGHDEQSADGFRRIADARPDDVIRYTGEDEHAAIRDKAGHTWDPADLHQSLLRVLYSGYPADASGFSSLLPEENRDDIFRGVTQAAVWHLTEGYSDNWGSGLRPIPLSYIFNPRLNAENNIYYNENRKIKKEVKKLYKKLIDTDDLPDPPNGRLVLYLNTHWYDDKPGQNVFRLTSYETPHEATKPDLPATEPDLPATRPDLPATEPDLPATRPDLPERPDQPETPAVIPLIDDVTPYRTARHHSSSHSGKTYSAVHKTAELKNPVIPAVKATEPSAATPAVIRSEMPQQNTVFTGDRSGIRIWQTAAGISGLLLIGWILAEYRKRN